MLVWPPIERICTHGLGRAKNGIGQLANPKNGAVSAHMCAVERRSPELVPVAFIEKRMIMCWKALLDLSR
jgi:hypothetical protein